MTVHGGGLDAGAAEQAERAAASAAADAGVVVAELREPGHLRAAAGLFVEVWGSPAGAAPAPPELLRALSHTGNYVAGAFADGGLVGASAGFLADGGHGPALHSHITGLLPRAQRRGVGFALKLHQRAWALAHGLGVVTWTFDPLVRRNAFFNLGKLGAEATAFHADFYGSMDDALNAGDDSDRCEVTWDLAGARAAAASAGSLDEPDLDHLLAAGATVLLDADGDGHPRTAAGGGDLRLCWVPEDILALRALDPGAARAWRLALRQALGASIGEGLVATAMTRSGWYVLERRR